MEDFNSQNINWKTVGAIEHRISKPHSEEFDTLHEEKLCKECGGQWADVAVNMIFWRSKWNNGNKSGIKGFCIFEIG